MIHFAMYLFRGQNKIFLNHKYTMIVHILWTFQRNLEATCFELTFYTF